MSRYATRHEHQGPWPVLALIDCNSGMSVRLANRGATLLDFHAPVDGRLYNIADGYQDSDELTELKGAHFGVLWPFGNRIADARYRFEGREYDLQPGVTGDARGIRHGFVRDADFDLLSVDADDTGVCARFGYSGVRPDVHPGYPFAVDLELAFTLHAGGLDLQATMHNVGTQTAPCFFGWHPYFRLREDGIDHCHLRLPAQQVVRTNDKLIPLPRAAAFEAVQDNPTLDFHSERAIGDSVLDTGYAELKADADGRIRSHLRDPDSGLAVAMWQESGVIVAYTGDTLAQGQRRAIAVEPMQAMVDAFNRENCADAITLKPDAEKTFRCGVELLAP